MHKFIRNHHPLTSNQLPAANSILPTSTIIELARQQGVDFGPGNPQERIRYLIKLELLPHQIRKTLKGNEARIVKRQAVTSDHSNRQTPEATSIVTDKRLAINSPVGHLPYWTIDRLKEIDQLLKQGSSFPQIATRFARLASDESELMRLPATSHQLLATSFAFRSILAISIITISLLALFYIGLTSAAPTSSVLGTNTVCPLSK